MLRFPHGFALSGVACVLVVGLGLGAAASSSEAQPGTMHNCPPAGKWSMAVWEGAGGTTASDSLATCGADAVAAAYSLDAQTGAWSRWFAGEPDVSNLPPLSDMQGVLALGSAQVQASPIAGLPNPAAVYCVELGYEWSIVETPEGQAGVCVFPDDTQCDEWSFFEGECGQSWATETEGTMHGCPPAGRWSLAVWDGAGGTTAGDALATCGADAVQAAYSLDAQTGAWSRWFAGKPDVSNLAPLSNMQGVLALGSAATATPTPTPTATPTPTRTPTPTPEAPGEGPQVGTYSGTTSQGDPIEFDVAEGSIISRIKFLADGTCGDGCSCQGDVESNFGVTPPTVVNNAFSHSTVDYDISGTFGSTTTASGNLDYHHNGVGPSDVDCDSGPLTWTASLQ